MHMQVAQNRLMYLSQEGKHYFSSALITPMDEDRFQLTLRCDASGVVDLQKLPNEEADLIAPQLIGTSRFLAQLSSDTNFLSLVCQLPHDSSMPILHKEGRIEGSLGKSEQTTVHSDAWVVQNPWVVNVMKWLVPTFSDLSDDTSKGLANTFKIALQNGEITSFSTKGGKGISELTFTFKPSPNATPQAKAAYRRLAEWA